MARIRLSLLERSLFETEMVLRVTDMNYGGHLSNEVVLSLVHEARVRFLCSYGYSELDIEGVGIIMSDAAVVYKSQGRAGEVVCIRLDCQDFNQHGFDMVYHLTERDSGRELARVKTGIVAFDYASGKISSLPSAFRERIEASGVAG